MIIPLQLGFTDYEQTYAKKKTRRQIFLENMEATIPGEHVFRVQDARPYA